MKPQNSSKELLKRNRHFLIDESAISNDFKITESGDIFRKDMYRNPVEQFGHCFTNMNTLIEARFVFGSPKDGKALILYPNAEFYDGSIKGIF